jgi:hypothetical protein
MRTIEIKHFEDCIVLHFETEGHRINAYTLASTLVGLADAAKAANESINHGHDVEIVVEAIGPGSFRAKLKALYRAHGNLFSQQVVLALVVGILGNYIYERAFAVKSEMKVQINTDEVIIQSGDEKIIVPRQVYEATRQVEKEPKFVNAIARTFEAISEDQNVKSFGLVNEMDSPKPAIGIPQAVFPALAATVLPEPDTRVVCETVELQIIKAILERGNRKWEFTWHGIKIHAPITHIQFYERFDAHSITIAPGDVLKAKLQIRQNLDARTGVYSNVAYEVVEVFEHVPWKRQSTF